MKSLVTKLQCIFQFLFHCNSSCWIIAYRDKDESYDEHQDGKVTRHMSFCILQDDEHLKKEIDIEEQYSLSEAIFDTVEDEYIARLKQAEIMKSEEGGISMDI